MEDSKYYGLREVLPKFRSASVVVLSGNRRGGGRRRRGRSGDVARTSRWRRLYMEV